LHRPPLAPKITFQPTPDRPMRQTANSHARVVPDRYTSSAAGMPSPAGMRHHATAPKNDLHHDGNLAFHQKAYRQAIKLYTRALAEKGCSRNPDILRCRAACAAWCGDLRGALFDMKQLVEVMPHSSKARFLHRCVADAINAVANVTDASNSTMFTVCQYLTPDEFKANDFRSRMLNNEHGPKPSKLLPGRGGQMQLKFGIPPNSHNPVVVSIKDLEKAQPATRKLDDYMRNQRPFWETSGLETRKLHGATAPLSYTVPGMSGGFKSRSVRGEELSRTYRN